MGIRGRRGTRETRGTRGTRETRGTRGTRKQGSFRCRGTSGATTNYHSSLITDN
ncbi:hypothetical protein [Chroococcidiopsis sp. CCNUC1]|uniref:hypothetical protein n=1 Tax=Chroococcidiopsis sp. CCNUC1 TaxID=2653189 RepID=UPI0020212AB1|nr:hypothetical protein [Chroococcidiopsis sp. CCNUC1]URD53084.1 hypothetical protein M5J74_14030 [Chroococcidiopsis sp. CCNUC1]